jgi:hypothetical protein
LIVSRSYPSEIFDGIDKDERVIWDEKEKSLHFLKFLYIWVDKATLLFHNSKFSKPRFTFYPAS